VLFHLAQVDSSLRVLVQHGFYKVFDAACELQAVGPVNSSRADLFRRCKRQSSCNKRVEQDAASPDCLRVSVVSALEEPFWRVVLRSAREIVEFVFFGERAAAEIDQRRLQIRRHDQNILELDIAVEHGAILTVLDAVDHLEHDFLRFLFCESLALGDVVEEVHDRSRARHHDEEAVGALEPFQHFHDSRVSLFVHAAEKGDFHWNLSAANDSPSLDAIAHDSFDGDGASISSPPARENGSVRRVGQHLSQRVEISQRHSSVSLWFFFGR